MQAAVDEPPIALFTKRQGRGRGVQGGHKQISANNHIEHDSIVMVKQNPSCLNEGIPLHALPPPSTLPLPSPLLPLPLCV